MHQQQQRHGGPGCLVSPASNFLPLRNTSAWFRESTAVQQHQDTYSPREQAPSKLMHSLLCSPEMCKTSPSADGTQRPQPAEGSVSVIHERTSAVWADWMISLKSVAHQDGPSTGAGLRASP